MTLKEKIGWAAGAVLATLIVLGGWSLFQSGATFGSVTSPWTTFSAVQFTQGIRVPGGPGITTSGSTIQAVYKGTCALIAPTYSVAASTSVAMDCPATGVQSGDLAFAWFATTTPSAAGPGWEIVRSSASSTAGYITLSVTNGTEATAIIPASIASTTQYLDLR